MKEKTRFHQSINTKIVLIFVILLLFALQLIGANFITQLEKKLLDSYHEDRQTQLEFLETTIEPYLQAATENEEEESPTEDIQSLLSDFSGSGISEILVVDAESVIVATSDRTQLSVVGRRSDDLDTNQAMLLEETVKRQVIDPITNTRRWKMAIPILKDDASGELLGAISIKIHVI